MAHKKLHSYLLDFSTEQQNSGYRFKRVSIKVNDCDDHGVPYGPLNTITVHLNEGVDLLQPPSETYQYTDLYIHPLMEGEVHIEEGGKPVYDVNTNATH